MNRNRLKLWLYMLLFAIAGAANLLGLTSDLSARALREADGGVGEASRRPKITGAGGGIAPRAAKNSGAAPGSAVTSGGAGGVAASAGAR